MEERRHLGFHRVSTRILYHSSGLVNDHHIFFQFISARYMRDSLILTSNRSVRDWVHIFAEDEMATTAIIDHILHRVHLFNIDGRSYRLKDLETAIKGGEINQRWSSGEEEKNGGDTTHLTPLFFPLLSYKEYADPARKNKPIDTSTKNRFLDEDQLIRYNVTTTLKSTSTKNERET